MSKHHRKLESEQFIIPSCQDICRKFSDLKYHRIIKNKGHPLSPKTCSVLLKITSYILKNYLTLNVLLKN